MLAGPVRGPVVAAIAEVGEVDVDAERQAHPGAAAERLRAVLGVGGLVRRSELVQRVGERLANTPGAVSVVDCLDVLALLRGERQRLEEVELRAVEVLRRHEVAWYPIGMALGCTPSTAQTRAVERWNVLARRLHWVQRQIRERLG
jgi:hypothetical protein